MHHTNQSKSSSQKKTSSYPIIILGCVVVLGVLLYLYRYYMMSDLQAVPTATGGGAVITGSSVTIPTTSPAVAGGEG